MQKKKSEFWEWIRSIAIAIILAFLIRFFVIEIFLVEGNSMYPTLQDNERLIVNKFIYHLQEPERGEIIVFRYSPSRDFIKRIAAVEGDVLSIREGQVYINDTPLSEPYFENINRVEDFGPVVVPPDHVFVLGDNRTNSMDSRDPSVGFISMESVKGRAFFVFWPPQEFRLLN